VTVFLRALEPSVDEKEGALLSSIRALRTASLDRATFEVSPEAFQKVPGSPFAYWTSETIRSVFVTNAPFEADGRTVKQGLATADDFRFVRAWWEVAEARCGSRWFPFAKGGSYSPFYADVFLCVNWSREGDEIKNNLNAHGGVRSNVWMLRDTADKFFFRPGLTWPLRGVRLSAQAVPAGCIFSVAGKMAFADDGALPTFLALFNSRPFDFLVNTRAGKVGGVQYEVGLVQSTPVPNLQASATTRLDGLARRGWSLKRTLDTTNEISHAFVLPGEARSKVGAIDVPAIERELADLQREIDELVFELYGLGAEDRATIEASTKRATSSSEDDASSDDGVDADDEAAVGEGSDALRSWLVGVAFGRFDPRLATGERPIPPEPEPFDLLPTRSPGMYPEGEEPTDRPDILVDDEGHPDDLTARALAVAERVKVDAPENLRAWLAREFFPLHIKMYSKSRRKAPIYWQLATPSASYSVWLYIHAFSKDTLFRVQNDYVAPKLAHEERRLESLTAELRDGATATQRKQLAAQEAFVEELRTFLDEVKRVAPLWNPNLDDGVIINFAPLWRLVPQNKAWQKELKSTWDALCEGKYDWAHLAMHLWPERVVAKCAKDRSLAIAHGLEDVFWVEGTDGKWTARKTPTRSIEELVRERTSPAVKSALESLLEAPVAAGKSGVRRGGGRRKSAAATEGGDA
jgi:hypothetical protein